MVKKTSPHRTRKSHTKSEKMVKLLRRRSSASIAELQNATGWQAHSVRGFISGSVRKRMKLHVTSEKRNGADLRYIIIDQAGTS